MLPQCWCCKTSTEATRVIKELRRRKGMKRTTKNWLLQSIGKVLTHMDNTDFSDGIFLESVGLEVREPVVVISLCEDKVILIEYLVLCDGDGESVMVSRQEALDLIPELPTPSVIAKRCKEIRNEKPLSSYNDQWVGQDGPAIREF